MTQLTPAELAQAISRQTPDARANMKNNLKVPPLALDRWLKKPDEAGILDDEHIEQLHNWVTGKYAHVSSKSGYVLLEEELKPVQVMPAAVRTKAMGKAYGHPADGPNVPLGMKTVRPALRGDKLPTPDEAALAKVKETEAKERAAAKKSRNPVKRVAEAIVMKRIQY